MDVTGVSSGLSGFANGSFIKVLIIIILIIILFVKLYEILTDPKGDTGEGWIK